MPLTSFCGLLTLQVGAAVLSAVFITLAAVIIAANVFDYTMDEGYTWPVDLTLLIIFVVGLIITALLMFASSYGESRSMAMIALIGILILTVYWVIICCFSFANNATHVAAVCIFSRCPETLWLANLAYRNSTEEKSSEFKEDYGGNMYRDDVDYTTEFYSDEYGQGQQKPYSSHNPNYHFVGSIILFITNILFFLFSAFVMWSWASELDWADYYIEDEPVVVYEDDPLY